MSITADDSERADAQALEIRRIAAMSGDTADAIAFVRAVHFAPAAIGAPLRGGATDQEPIVPKRPATALMACAGNFET